MEDEQDFLDMATLTDPLSLHGMGTEQRKEGGDRCLGRDPIKFE